jgi:hypothetical protein
LWTVVEVDPDRGDAKLVLGVGLVDGQAILEELSGIPAFHPSIFDWVANKCK